MKYIKFSQGKVALVDDEDFEWLNKWKWHFHNKIAERTIWLKDKKTCKKVRMHNVIINPSLGKVVDHINRNRLDNRKSNLRIATNQENQRNRGVSKSNISGYKGVHFKKRGNWYGYYVQIKISYKPIHLGVYRTAKEAALVYNLAAKKYFGEFAVLNEI